MSALRFGLDVPTAAGPGDDPVAAAQEAERRGYDFVSASDHPRGDHPTYETVTMLTWIAAQTSRISVATRVLGVPFRRPAMVAKLAESLDRFSGGRLVLGLGAGASDDEIRSVGGPVPSTRQKIDGLADAVRILRGTWDEDGFTYQGTVHRADDLRIAPKPAHRIPIWLGTYGPRALALTGRLADGWIPSLGFAPPERIPAMKGRLLDAAAAAGRRAEEITSIYNVEVHVDPRAARRVDLVTGSAADVADQLRGFLDLGFDGFNIKPDGPDRVRQVAQVAEEVLPAVRS